MLHSDQRNTCIFKYKMAGINPIFVVTHSQETFLRQFFKILIFFACFGVRNPPFFGLGPFPSPHFFSWARS